MQKIINFFRGSVSFTVTGAFPERFLNLCAQNGVGFWAVEWLDGGVRLTVSRFQWRRAKGLAEKVACTITPERGRGVPSFLERFRKRYALLTGLALSLLAVCVLSQFILTVEVSGNTTVSTAEILTALRRLDLRPGTYGPSVDEAMVGQQLLLRVDGLSWCAVNLKGTVAEVLVREGVPKPELLDEKTLGDVVAEAPGIITRMEVLEGEAQRKIGEAVLPGEVVIAGNIHMEGPAYSTTDLGWRQVKAQGFVFARTWRTLEAQIPLEAKVKRYTGEEKSFWSLEALGSRVNFYGNAGISYVRYDKIANTWAAHLPGGRELPFSLCRQTVRAYDLVSVPIDETAAEELLRRRLEQTLTALLGKDGEAVKLDYAVRQDEKRLIVTLTAECREEIGKFVPFAPAPTP